MNRSPNAGTDDQPLAGQAAHPPAPADAPDTPAALSPLKRLFSSYAVLILIVICVVATALLLAGFGGVIAGQNERGAQATQTTVAEMDLQYELGVADLEAGRYELAIPRFQWIIDRDPAFPGAADRLAEAQQKLNAGPAAGDAGTPVPPSEADTHEERFSEAKELYDAGQWAAAIDRLQMLQALAPGFRTAEVEDMLYESLKNLGLRYIRTDERLEEGIVLLDQANMIRPLDDISEGERLIAALYVSGKTYWGLNWPLVIQNFSEIYSVAPNYRDVEDRLWEAYVKYADQLWLGGFPCDSVSLYQSAGNIRYTAEIQDKIEGSTDACENPTPTPTPTQAGGQPPGEGTPPADGTPPPPGEGAPPPLEG